MEMKGSIGSRVAGRVVKFDVRGCGSVGSNGGREQRSGGSMRRKKEDEAAG